MNVTCTKNTKFLGVIIDNKLRWSDHINYIKNKISKSIEIINKTRNFLNKNTLRNLYYTFIYPYLIYCIEIWGNTNDIHLDSLIKIKKSIRVISFSHHRDTTAPLFQNLNILNFKKLVTQRIALLMFKYHKGMLPDPINNLVSLSGGLLSISSKCLTLLHYCIFELFIFECEFSCLVMSCIYTSGLNIQ